jgi:ribosomal protein S27AE
MKCELCGNIDNVMVWHVAIDKSLCAKCHYIEENK